MHKFIWLLLIIPFFAAAQKKDRRLESKIHGAVNGYKGEIGLYIKNLRTGKTVSLNADTIFPTASIVKVPILVGIMDKMERKELNYDSALVYKDSLLYAGSDILGSFKNNEKILLKKVIIGYKVLPAVVPVLMKSWNFWI